MYELAKQILELAPWQELYEKELFAVQDPDSGLTGYVSVMGNLGEHRALAVYQGEAGLNGFLNLQGLKDEPAPLDVLTVPQLQLSFENKMDLEGEDLQIIQGLELRIRSGDSWPQFRSYKPCHAPWFLEPAEIDFLRVVLEQCIALLRDRSKVAEIRETSHKDMILTRRAKKSGHDWLWSDSIEPLPPPRPPNIAYMVSHDLVEEVGRLQRRNQEILLDVEMLLTPVKDKTDDRPYFPFLLLAVDKKTELILYNDLLKATTGWERFLAEIPNTVLLTLSRLGFIPSQIHVRKPFLQEALLRPANELNFRCKKINKMPLVDEFIMGYRERWGR